MYKPASKSLLVIYSLLLFVVGVAFTLSASRTALAEDARPAVEDEIVEAETEKSEEPRPPFEDGIAEFEAERYEEALEDFLMAFEQEPESAEAAFYTGLTYKKILQYLEARKYLEESVRLKTSYGEAYVELGEVLYGLNLYREAARALAEAERLRTRPAHTAYLMGLVSLKVEEYDQAIGYLKAAVSADASYEQKSSYFFGMAYFGKGMNDEAREAFKKTASVRPNSLLAVYARRNLGMLKTNESENKRLTLIPSYSIIYDDNVILKPVEEVSGVAISGEADFRHVLRLKAEHLSKLGESMSLSARYKFYQSIHHEVNNLNVQAHRFSLAPFIKNRKSESRLTVGYDYFLLDNNAYYSAFSLTPSYLLDIGEGERLTFFAGVTKKDFLKTPSNASEDRDSLNITAGAGYLLFDNEEKWQLSVKYAFDRDETEGAKWEYDGHKLTTSFLYRATEQLDLSVTGRYYLQDYSNTSRKDGITVIAPGLIYRHNDLSFKLQYAHTRAESTSSNYDYRRNIYGIGVEYVF